MELTKKQLKEIIDNVWQHVATNEIKTNSETELIGMAVRFTLDELNLQYEDEE